jgi:hypothetical protein
VPSKTLTAPRATKFIGTVGAIGTIAKGKNSRPRDTGNSGGGQQPTSRYSRRKACGDQAMLIRPSHSVTDSNRGHRAHGKLEH